MATFQLPARRLILAGGFAVAIAAAPAIAVFAVPSASPSAPSLAACPSGESEDLFTDACVPEIVPNSPQMTTPVGGLPEINGIPCTGHNSGQCIGLSEEGPIPIVQPSTSVSSSP
jgi:hypothetical protein